MPTRCIHEYVPLLPPSCVVRFAAVSSVAPQLRQSSQIIFEAGGSEGKVPGTASVIYVRGWASVAEVDSQVKGVSKG